MPAILGALQFNDHEVPVPIDPDQIDSAPRSLPLTELLRDNEGIGVNHLDILTKQPL